MTAALDLALCLLLIFTIIAITASQSRQQLVTQGAYAVTISWRAGSNDDVDLWVRDPRGQICYFVNPSVDLMHLEHDDLGSGISGTLNGNLIYTANNERTIISSAQPGWYVANVMLYNRVDPGPIEVTVELWSIASPGSPLITKQEMLLSNGDWKTAFRFHIGSHGQYLGYDTLQTDLQRVDNPAIAGTGVSQQAGP